MLGQKGQISLTTIEILSNTTRSKLEDDIKIEAEGRNIIPLPGPLAIDRNQALILRKSISLGHVLDIARLHSSDALNGRAVADRKVLRQVSIRTITERAVGFHVFERGAGIYWRAREWVGS